MAIFIHNTLTRQKQEFIPINPKKVRVYFCGPTVYSYAHIGNGRAAVVFDLLVRVLRRAYGASHVQYVQNITDIDDKIIDAAAAANCSTKDIADKFEKIYNEDMRALGVEKPDFQPKATDYVPQMLAMIDRLINAGHAYQAEGHVLFSVPSWPGYGRLSRRSRDDLIAGARVEVAPYKKDPADFVLWKPSAPGRSGPDINSGAGTAPEQPGWDSPYGRGRPGWHLECSAMNEALNGNHFDIHAGGEDLIFPHHENEIAQSVCAHDGEPYVNYWMHNGWLMVEGKKMSKSLGNVLLVHDLIRRIPGASRPELISGASAPGEVIRYALLSAQYRQPFDWTEDLLQQSKRVLDRYYGLLRDAKDIKAAESAVPEDFIAALEDDLNTPQAFAVLAALAKSLSTAKDETEKEKAKGALLAAGKLMGLLQQDVEAWFLKHYVLEVDAGKYEVLLEERNLAKKNKDYKKADQIRLDLEKEGIILEDTPTGPRLKRKDP